MAPCFDTNSYFLVTEKLYAVNQPKQCKIIGLCDYENSLSVICEIII